LGIARRSNAHNSVDPCLAKLASPIDNTDYMLPLKIKQPPPRMCSVAVLL
jgi:hypothetical protein